MVGWIAILYFVSINILSLVLMAQDKFSARTNRSGEQRTPEGQLFFLAILGGALGIYLGMFLFRHKTQKVYFFVGMPLLLAQQLSLLFFLFPFLHI